MQLENCPGECWICNEKGSIEQRNGQHSRLSMPLQKRTVWIDSLIAVWIVIFSCHWLCDTRRFKSWAGTFLLATIFVGQRLKMEWRLLGGFVLYERQSFYVHDTGQTDSVLINSKLVKCNSLFKSIRFKIQRIELTFFFFNSKFNSVLTYLKVGECKKVQFNFFNSKFRLNLPYKSIRV